MKQALLRSVLPDGCEVLLVVLHDDRCAVLRNNQVVHEAAGDADGIDGAVQRYMLLTQVTEASSDGDAKSQATGHSATLPPTPPSPTTAQDLSAPA